MGLTVEDFITRFPEFAGIDPSFLEAKLTEALVFVPLDPWGDAQATGQGYYAADLLALSPFGNGTAMVQKDGSSVYAATIRRLNRLVSAGIRST